MDFLIDFRRSVRKRFSETALGNGKIFAADFEGSVSDLLVRLNAGGLNYNHQIPPFPASELMRRAYVVASTGAKEAAARILQYCLDIYPQSGLAHLFAAQQMAGDLGFSKARDYLLERIDGFSEEEQVGILIMLVRWSLLIEEESAAQGFYQRLAEMPLTDAFDIRQVDLYRAYWARAAQQSSQAGARAADASGMSRIEVIIPTDSQVRFDQMVNDVSHRCEISSHISVSYKRTDKKTRISAYEAAFKGGADIVILLQENVSIHAPDFFASIVASLRDVDIVGIAGAKRWIRVDWRADRFDQKAAGFIVPSWDKDGCYELQCLGSNQDVLVKDMAVLDGSLLAVRSDGAMAKGWDADLVGSGMALEEGWSHQMALAGSPLGVHRCLGILVARPEQLRIEAQSVATLKFQEDFGFDPFQLDPSDSMLLNVPIQRIVDAVSTMKAYCTPS